MNIIYLCYIQTHDVIHMNKYIIKYYSYVMM